MAPLAKRLVHNWIMKVRLFLGTPLGIPHQLIEGGGGGGNVTLKVPVLKMTRLQFASVI